MEKNDFLVKIMNVDEIVDKVTHSINNLLDNQYLTNENYFLVLRKLSKELNQWALDFKDE